MTAVLVIIVGAALAWFYTKALDRLTGEQAMTLGPLILAPYVVIAVGVVIALVVMT